MAQRTIKDEKTLRKLCDEYFDQCDRDGILYDEAGLLLHLHVLEPTWNSWWEGTRCPDLMDETRRACMRIQHQLLTDSRWRTSGGLTSMAIFLLKQKRLGGYTDKVMANTQMNVNVKYGDGMDESDFK